MSTLSIVPIAAGVYNALNVSTLTDLANGPFDTEAPQGTAFPYCWFVVNAANDRGFGRGGFGKCFLRVHAAARGDASLSPANQVRGILTAAVGLLKDATLTVSGHQQGGEIFYVDTTEPFASQIGGEPCWEGVSTFYFWMDPTS